MLSSCTELDGGLIAVSGSNHALLDSDVERIKSAYEALERSSADRCRRSTPIIMLEASVGGRPDPDVFLASDEHSGCALPHLDGHDFVAGLDELLSVLRALSAN